MPNTTHGFPYPASSDPVSQGATAIQNLASAVDTKLTPTLSATPPGSPTDGQLWALAADATGVVWMFRYNAGSASAYKWEFVGGSVLFNEVLASESTSSATYVALTTAGPAITVPRAGDYDIMFGAAMSNANNGQVGYMSVDVGAAAANDNDAAAVYAYESGSTVNISIAASRALRKSGVAASAAIVAKYRSTVGALTAGTRWMRVVPIRVS